MKATDKQPKATDDERERVTMVRYATRHHRDHADRRDEWCRVCKRMALQEWARQHGLI